MRLIRLLIQNSPQNSFVFRSFRSQKDLIVRVVTIAEDDSVKLSFSNSSSLSIKAPKQQDVSSVLSVIKLKYALLRKREELRRSIINKYSNTAHVAVETTEEFEDVHLFESSKLIDDRTPNIVAWSQASVLKIGDIIYKVQFNTPAVKSMSLPDYIVSGCYIRPHFLLECASLEDCVFTWYRATDNDIELDRNSLANWVKISEGFNYLVSTVDIGYHLKVVCSPREGSRIGLDFASISKNIVESGLKLFPFEERQVYTKSNCDNTQ